MERSITVLGYHGTSERAARTILEPGRRTAGRFLASERDTDWLGNGVYFVQDAPYRAEDQATTADEDYESGCAMCGD